MSHPPSSRRVVAVDLDGVLAQYDTKERGLGVIGAPVPGMVELVKRLVGAGATVVVFTARAGNSMGVDSVERWLARHGFPALEVTNLKSHRFSVYLDDQTVRFDPAMSPAALAETLLTSRPWWDNRGPDA